MRRAKPHYWKGAVFPFHASRHKKTTSQWINEFTINLESQTKVIVVPAAWKKGRIMQLPKQIKEWPPQHTEKRGSDCSVRRSQSISSPSRDHGAANEPGDCLSTTHRDKRVWTKPPAEWETAQTNRFKWVDGYKKIKDTKDFKKIIIQKGKIYKQTLKRNKTPAWMKKKMRKRTTAWRTTKSTWESWERWTSVWEEQVYIPPEERQQPKSWEQTNKRRGKETTKQIKLNDKKLFHHSLVNLVPRRLWCTAVQL